MSRYAGFDTSNYKTSAACLENGTPYMEGKLLPVAEGALGLRQSDAVFAHTRAMPEIVRALYSHLAKCEIRAIGVSATPRTAEGSYMPCFLVGVNAAETLGAAAGVPVYRFSHQQGHLAAAAFGAGELHLLKAPFLAWHLSGGTTELLLVRPDAECLFAENVVGGTKDIAGGQLIDRAGTALGLHFPAGPALEALSEQTDDCKGYAVKVENCSFSLSGMENKLKKDIKDGVPPEIVAAKTIATVRRAVVSATEQALCLYPGLPVLCAGGVMSNRRIQKMMKEKFGAVTAPAVFASDNALGCAVLAAVRSGDEIWKNL